MIEVHTLKPGEVIVENGIYAAIDIERYHSGNLCDGPSISSSGLRRIFAQSEMDYWVYSSLNPLRLEEPEKEEWTIGSAVHHLSLGEAAFDKRFIIRPAADDKGDIWQSNKTWCKAWLKAQKDRKLGVLKGEQVEQIKGMVGVLPWQTGLDDSGLHNNAMVRGGLLSGLIEHTIAWKDPETGIWLLSRPDAIPLDSEVHADLKTTISVSDEALEYAVSDWRYDMQGALGSMLMRLVGGIDIKSFAFVFVSKKPPHTVRVKELWPSDLDEAKVDNDLALKAFARGLSTGKWPGPGGSQRDASFVSVKSWTRKMAEERRIIMRQEIGI